MKFWFSLCFALFLSISAFAQGVIVSGGYGGTFYGGIGSNVKGAPFSAEVVTETMRVLQDGNRIHTVENGKMYRDSEGRTRNEESPMQDRASEVKFVHIFDSVDRALITYTLASNGPTVANVHHLAYPTSAAAVTPRPSVATPNPKSQNVKQSADQPCPVPPQAENLGTKVLEGMTVVGTRRKNTIPAGTIGNEKSIVIVEESWYSDELHEVLLSERDDPQSGHTTRKLVNIQRGEQDPALFQAPPEYTIKDDSQ